VLGPQEEDRLDWEVRSYWANCAWDMLGLPAALHPDAEVETEYAEDGSPARSGGRDLTIYFLLGAVGPCLACAWSSEPAVRRLGRIRKGRVLRRRPPGAEIGETDGERSVARGRSPSR
jgi:hypothetical protein